MTILRGRALCPLLYMTALYGLSAIPDASGPVAGLGTALLKHLTPSAQDLLHIPAYAILAVLCQRALSLWLPQARAAGYTLTLVATFALSDEWHQSFVPGRCASADDLARDVLGALFALVASAYFRRAGPASEDGIA